MIITIITSLLSPAWYSNRPYHYHHLSAPSLAAITALCSLCKGWWGSGASLSACSCCNFAVHARNWRRNKAISRNGEKCEYVNVVTAVVVIVVAVVVSRLCSQQHHVSNWGAGCSGAWLVEGLPKTAALGASKICALPSVADCLVLRHLP